jgi:hypothetical protein
MRDEHQESRDQQAEELRTGINIPVRRPLVDPRIIHSSQAQFLFAKP